MKFIQSTEKAQYDQFGHAAFDGTGGAGGGFGGFGGFGQGGFGGEGFGDIFDMFFGGGGAGGSARRRGPERGSDLRYNLSISFEEAAFGKTVELNIPRTEKCSSCNGTGAAAGTILKLALIAMVQVKYNSLKIHHLVAW